MLEARKQAFRHLLCPHTCIPSSSLRSASSSSGVRGVVSAADGTTPPVLAGGSVWMEPKARIGRAEAPPLEDEEGLEAWVALLLSPFWGAGAVEGTSACRARAQEEALDECAPIAYVPSVEKHVCLQACTGQRLCAQNTQDLCTYVQRTCVGCMGKGEMVPF
eukprot:scaffold12480_cov15-Tisochrysis_lutea.AAC.2